MTKRELNYLDVKKNVEGKLLSGGLCMEIRDYHYFGPPLFWVKI